MNRKKLAIIVGSIIVLFVLFPAMISEGAKRGLSLWFHTVLPALLPFMILSDFMMKQNISGIVSRVFYPLLAKCFGVSKAGCYPVVIGFLSGYPVGAKTITQLYREKMISKGEAQYLLSFCNNASPMFIMEFIGVRCMGMKHPFFLLLLIYVSAWINSFFSGRNRFYEENFDRSGMVCQRRLSVMEALDESILDGFTTIAKIGGYIMLFSILAQFVSDILPFPAIIKYIGIGILEITTGGTVISGMQTEKWIKDGILVSLCAFGGLSSVAQTVSVTAGTDLEMGTYLAAKLRQAIIAGGLAAVCFFME